MPSIVRRGGVGHGYKGNDGRQTFSRSPNSRAAAAQSDDPGYEDQAAELSMPGSVESIGLSIVVLSLVFACAALIRRWSRPLRKLFMPTAVIGGFLVLGLGPEGMGRLLGGSGVFPDDVFAVWKQMPGVLVTVMSASRLLGEPLPPVKTVWRISGSHVIIIAVMSMGQFALGGICVWLLLEPVFGIDSKAAALIEMSFAGGHGTLAGLTPVLQQHGVGDLLYLGLGLATIGMVTGVVVGTMLVNYAIKSPSIPVARQNPTSPDEDLDIDHHLPRPDDPPLDEWKGMPQVTAAAVCLGVTIAVAIVLLELFRAAFNFAGSGFFDNFPLFPFTFPAAVLVQFCARRKVSRGPSIAAPSKGLAGSRSTASLCAPSGHCRWRRSARTSAR